MKTRGFILGLFLGVSLMATMACGATGFVAEPTPTPTPTATSNASTNATFTVAVCTRVVDGDTIEVTVDDTEYTVRYIGIDTPELDDARPEYRVLAEEAAQANRDMVEGKNVSLQQDVSETDQYGRLLRYVFVGHQFVNAELVSDGYAWAVSYPPDTSYDSLFQGLASEAEQEGLGVWSLP